MQLTHAIDDVAPDVAEAAPVGQFRQDVMLLASTDDEYDPETQSTHVFEAVAATVLDHAPMLQLKHMLDDEAADVDE